MRRKGKRLSCALLALWMGLALPLSASAETLADIQAQQDALQAENQELQSKLETLREDQAQKEAYQNTLEEQINLVQEQILTTRQNIADLNESIQALTLKLQKSQEAVQGTIDAFRERLVALYTAGSVSTLEMLLDSASLAEFTTRMTMVDAMTSYDQELLDKLQAYMDSTQADRDQVRAQKQEVAQLQITLENKGKELDSLYEENAAALGQVQGQVASTEDQLKVNEEELAESERRVQEAIAAQKKAEEEARKREEEAQKKAEEEQKKQQQSTSSGGGGSPIVNPPSGGGGGSFQPIWPLPGVTYISDRFGGGRGHKGLDIAGPWGTPIVAAADGTVIEANDYDSWGYSWGYYVLIYHNGTYSTRYAHMSSVAVSAGQYVTAGTVIGYEGNTGNSFGPHLHFEVYENGTRVNPERFL